MDEVKISAAKRVSIHSAAHVTGEIANAIGRAGVALKHIRRDLIAAGVATDSLYFDSIDHDISRTSAAWHAFTPRCGTGEFVPEGLEPRKPIPSERIVPRPATVNDDAAKLIREIYTIFSRPMGAPQPEAKSGVADFVVTKLFSTRDHAAFMERMRTVLTAAGYTDLK